jgi:agmatinase
MSFDPNAAAAEGSGIFGLPDAPEDARVVLLPVPWDATTSYRAGTSRGPDAILKASKQVDLFDAETGKPYRAGIAMLPPLEGVAEANAAARVAAEKVIAVGGAVEGDRQLEEALAFVNAQSHGVDARVYAEVRRWLGAGKIVGVVGGDHSTPFGSIRAHAERWSGLGILHVDAHADLRRAYEGFERSHASIMDNVLRDVPGVARLVQVGVRDFCEEEVERIARSEGRVRTFFDVSIAGARMQGALRELFTKIADDLPRDVYVSFDVDGLDPALCPHTGTPVPGGLSFHEASALIGAVVASGRRIVGFDLNEVAPDPRGEDEWDANVGARLLYKLVGWTLLSQGIGERPSLP